MANFVLVVDSERSRREHFISRARPLLGVVSGQEEGVVAVGNFHVAWMAGPGAPVDADSDLDGAGIVWGDALDTRGSRLSGRQLRNRCIRQGEQLDAWDGFHALACFRDGDSEGSAQRDTLLAGADLLGLFPVYYWSSPDVLLAASSPELLPQHDAFNPELDHAGLVGILLTGGPVRGRTLWRGVSRLAPGYVLRWTQGSGATQELVYQIPSGQEQVTRPADQLELLDEAMGGWAARIPAGREQTLLLSGGRDSRLIAGAMAEVGEAPSALTLGRPSDHEVPCAGGVARALNLKHRVEDVDDSRFPAFAKLSLTWEHLQGHFAGLYTWGTGPRLRLPTARQSGVVSGHLFELVCGGAHLSWAQAGAQDSNGEPHRNPFLRYVYRHGIPPPALERLLRKDRFNTLVAEVDAEVRDIHRSYPGPPEEGHLRFLFEHWGRHHPGMVPWRLSFWAWPSLPVLDRKVLAVATALPAGAVEGRRLQHQLLRARFPALARVPMEAGGRPPRSVSTGRLARLRAAWTRRRHRPPPGIDAWFYRRLYDPDGEGWQPIREWAESSLEDALPLFDKKALRQFLPPPGTPWPGTDPIIDSFGRKTLLGFFLWADRWGAGGA